MPLECFLLNITLKDLPRKCEKKAENAGKCGLQPPPPPPPMARGLNPGGGGGAIKAEQMWYFQVCVRVRLFRREFSTRGSGGWFWEGGLCRDRVLLARKPAI